MKEAEVQPSAPLGHFGPRTACDPMIISHKHRFIFVRCRKTASTTTEIFLSKWSGPQDIITSFCSRDEALRLACGGLPPQNESSGRITFYNHMPAKEIRDAVGSLWDSYYKFCFERNPWDKVISLYFHRHKSEPRIPFDAFLESGEALDARNLDLYTIDGALAVNRVARYERLAEDLADICSRLQLPEPGNLAAAKSQFRIDRRLYRDFLNPRQRSYIDHAFAEEIRMHGYVY